jgi:hypothetical protein
MIQSGEAARARSDHLVRASTGTVGGFFSLFTAHRPLTQQPFPC